jgi:hypothetical protein
VRLRQNPGKERDAIEKEGEQNRRRATKRVLKGREGGREGGRTDHDNGCLHNSELVADAFARAPPKGKEGEVRGHLVRVQA